jgi:hypothetical protein
MAKVPAVKGKTQVVAWQEKLAEEAAAAASGESVSSEFVSFRGGQLSFNGNLIPGNKMNVIVLDSAYEHAWYPGAFDPNNPRSPACYSMGRIESELVPVEDAEDRQGGEDGGCATCPLNAWGSDPDGGKGKACKNVRRIVLMDAEALKNGEAGIAAANTVMAKLPVTSGKNYSAFVIQIANVTKRPPYGVIAELSLVPDARTQFQVKWSFVDMVPDALIPAIMDKKASLGDTVLYTYPPNEEAAPAPAPAPSRGKATTRPAARKLG